MNITPKMRTTPKMKTNKKIVMNRKKKETPKIWMTKK